MNRLLLALSSGILAASALLAAPAPTALKLPAFLSAHMVLQRDMPVPIWGLAATGQEVTVEFAGQKKTARADDQGRWRVTLDPLAASAESRTLTVSALPAKGEKQKLELDDVLVGDVWVGAGQSNMAQTGMGYTNDPVLVANAKESYPLLRLATANKSWSLASSNANPRFSALLFSFGVPLQKEIKVPVGLIVGAVGGTPSGYWLSKEAYESDAGCKAEVEKAAAAFVPSQYEAQCATLMQAWTQSVAVATKAGAPAPAQPKMPLKPGEIQAARLGYLYDAHIKPLIPYAIKGVLWDQGESGTAIGGVNQDTLMNALIRGWRKEWGQGDFPFLYVQKPSGGGCAWDPADPVTAKAEPLAALPRTPAFSGSYRETHLRIRLIPGTFMVTSSDLGSGTHPVCKSGYGARAARVALGAVYDRPLEIYGPTLAANVVEGGKVRLTFDHVGQGLAFPANAPANGAGPAVLQGFAVAGTNRVFQWAAAVIEGNSIVVSSDKVPQPVAVRYAWSQQHAWANLFNRDGLPAQAFRTDTW
jgi:sialate O-acetylesterase